MRKGMMLGAAGLAVALLAGCGGSSTPAGNAVTRVLVGFVYVTKNDGGTYAGASTAFVLPHNNLTVFTPQGGNPVPVDKPTAGTIQLSVANGTLTKQPATLNFDLSQTNEIICSAGGAANAAVTVTVAAPIMNGSVVKALSIPVISLGTATGTVLGIQSPNTPTYTPGNPDSIIVRLNTTIGVGGVPATGAILSPDQMMASNGTGLGSGFEAGQVYTVSPAVLDKNGIVVTGASTTLTSSDNTRVLPGVGTLTAVAGQTAAAGIQITTSVTGFTLVSQTFQGPYNPGTPTAVTLAPAGPTDLLWAAAGVPAAQALTATVANEVGSPMPGVTVNLTSNKETALGSNVWNCGAFVSATAVFTPNTGATNAAGQLATLVTAPTSTGALPPGNPAKGHATMTATAGAATGQAVINITRPLGTVSITGPARMDVGTVSPATSLVPTAYYHVTGATDIDTDPVVAPAVTWTIVNTPVGGNLVGNTGDTSPRSLSVASIDANTGVVTAGGISGEATVSVTANGAPTVVPVITEIFGDPSKIYFNPDTAVTAIVGANGEYAGAANTTQQFSFTLIDAYGHTIPFSEITPLTTTSSISSLAAGTISQGGLNVESFTLTFGNTSGTFTIGTGQFTWTGTAGGAPTPLGGITKTAGVHGS